MNRVLLTLILILGISSFAAAQRAETGNSSVLVVNGEGQIRVDPDEASVTMGIVRQAPTAQAAQDQTNTAAAQILAAIKGAGIAAADIQTSRLSLMPVYAPRSPESSQAPRIAAYQASNIVTVRLTDLGKVGQVIDAGLKAGSNEIQRIQFGLRNDLPSRQQALKEAVADARKKAESIAEALNMQIGIPLEVSENGVSLMPKSDYGGAMMARSQEMAPTQVSPGQLEIRANVNIRYQLLPKR